MKAVTWPVVLVAHAYAGAVTAATRDEKVKRSSAALVLDEGETAPMTSTVRAASAGAQASAR